MEHARNELELTPDQPSEVAEEVARALEPGLPGPDPWWQAGLEEQLGQ
jgi:hypothetical protein